MKNNEAADEIGRSNAAFMLRAPLEDVILGAPKLGDDRAVEQGEFIRILERVRNGEIEQMHREAEGFWTDEKSQVESERIKNRRKRERTRERLEAQQRHPSSGMFRRTDEGVQ